MAQLIGVCTSLQKTSTGFPASRAGGSQPPPADLRLWTSMATHAHMQIPSNTHSQTIKNKIDVKYTTGKQQNLQLLKHVILQMLTFF